MWKIRTALLGMAVYATAVACNTLPEGPIDGIATAMARQSLPYANYLKEYAQCELYQPHDCDKQWFESQLAALAASVWPRVFDSLSAQPWSMSDTSQQELDRFVTAIAEHGENLRYCSPVFDYGVPGFYFRPRVVGFSCRPPRSDKRT